MNKFECVKYYLLSNTTEVGLELGLKYVQGWYILSVNKFECVKYYLLSNTPEVGL